VGSGCLLSRTASSLVKPSSTQILCTSRPSRSRVTGYTIENYNLKTEDPPQLGENTVCYIHGGGYVALTAHPDGPTAPATTTLRRRVPFTESLRKVSRPFPIKTLSSTPWQVTRTSSILASRRKTSISAKTPLAETSLSYSPNTSPITGIRSYTFRWPQVYWPSYPLGPT